jgi:hypothetical protein
MGEAAKNEGVDSGKGERCGERGVSLANSTSVDKSADSGDSRSVP